MNVPKKFVVIGMGNVGSQMVLCLAMKSLDVEIDEVVLIDDDMFLIKNGNSTSHYNMGKVYNTTDMALYFNPYLKLTPICEKLEEVEKDFKEEEDYYIIDCRDTNDKLYYSDLKLNYDMGVGKFIFGRSKSDISKSDRSLYIKTLPQNTKSVFNTMALCMTAVNKIYNKKKKREKNYVYSE